MKFNSKSRTKKILAATWLIPMVLASPYTFSKSYPFVISSPMGSIARQICNDRFDEIDAVMYGEGTKDRFRRGFFMFLFLVIYLVPMVVILATCVRIALCLLQPIAVRRWPSATGKDTGRRHEENKRRVARMVIVVAVAFIVSWSPFYLSTMVSQIQSIVTEGDHFLRERNFLFTMLMIHLCGFLNSCINPFIYTGMSKKFRRSFKMILGGCICCRLKHRFLRYRDSLTRGMSAAFTSSLRHSMTEVRDANDLALNEGSGGPPPTPSSATAADGSRYHACSSSLVHSSSGCGGGGGGGVTGSNSLHHHHHHHNQPQQHNHLRHHHDSAPCKGSADYSAVPGSPSSAGSKFGLKKPWASKSEKGNLIEMIPLQPLNGTSSGVNGQPDGDVLVSGVGDPTQDVLNMPLEKEKEEEKRKFLEEDEDFDQNEVAEVKVQLLQERSRNTCLDTAAPDKTDLPRNVLTSSSTPTKDAATSSPNRVYPAVRDQAYAMDVGLKESAAGFKRRDYKGVKKGGSPVVVDSGDPLGRVVRNGGSHLPLTHIGSTGHGTVPLRDSPLTNQNGGIVHVDVSTEGQCVRL